VGPASARVAANIAKDSVKGGAKDFRIALLLSILSGAQEQVKSAQSLCDRAKSINF
jgi:hypothetical protein